MVLLLDEVSLFREVYRVINLNDVSHRMSMGLGIRILPYRVSLSNTIAKICNLVLFYNPHPSTK